MRMVDRAVDEYSSQQAPSKTVHDLTSTLRLPGLGVETIPLELNHATAMENTDLHAESASLSFSHVNSWR